MSEIIVNPTISGAPPGTRPLLGGNLLPEMKTRLRDDTTTEAAVNTAVGQAIDNINDFLNLAVAKADMAKFEAASWSDKGKYLKPMPVGTEERKKYWSLLDALIVTAFDQEKLTGAPRKQGWALYNQLYGASEPRLMDISCRTAKKRPLLGGNLLPEMKARLRDDTTAEAAVNTAVGQAIDNINDFLNLAVAKADMAKFEAASWSDKGKYLKPMPVGTEERKKYWSLLDALIVTAFDQEKLTGAPRKQGWALYNQLYGASEPQLMADHCPTPQAVSLLDARTKATPSLSPDSQSAILIKGIDFPPKAVIEFRLGDEKENGITLRLDKVDESKKGNRVSEEIAATVTVAAGVPAGNYRLVILYPDNNAVAAGLDNALTVTPPTSEVIISPAAVAPGPEEIVNRFSIGLRIGGTGLVKKTPVEPAIREFRNPDANLRFELDNYDFNRHLDLQPDRFALRGDAHLGYDQNYSGGRGLELGAGMTPAVKLYDNGASRFGLGTGFGYAFGNSDRDAVAGPFAPSRRQHALSLGPAAAVEYGKGDLSIYGELSYRYGVNWRDYYARNYDGLGFSERTQTHNVGLNLRLNYRKWFGNAGGGYGTDETSLPRRFPGSNGRTRTEYLYPDINTWDFSLGGGYDFGGNNGRLLGRYGYAGSALAGLAAAAAPQGYSDHRGSLDYTLPYLNELVTLRGNVGALNGSLYGGGAVSLDVSTLWRTTRAPQPTIFPAALSAPRSDAHAIEPKTNAEDLDPEVTLKYEPAPAPLESADEFRPEDIEVNK